MQYVKTFCDDGMRQEYASADRNCFETLGTDSTTILPLKRNPIFLRQAVLSYSHQNEAREMMRRTLVF